jgi:dinuclear metal center YbgI/SA1388 family protein
MGLRVADIVGIIERLAPLWLAEDWDNVGLQVGSMQMPVSRIMTCLSADVAVLRQAKAQGSQLLVTHHPLVFRPLASLRSDRAAEVPVVEAVREGLAVYAAHTNLDAAPQGLGRWVGEALGIAGGRPLVPKPGLKLQKLVVYVPAAHVAQVREAICAAGAGHIGNYSHCTFAAVGTGTFLPLTGAAPYTGQVGRLTEVEEYRLETVVPAALSAQVLERMCQAHPYEEVAYDLFDLAQPAAAGYGWVGDLPQPLAFAELRRRVQEQLGAGSLRIAGPIPARIGRLAVVNGAGAEYIEQAAAAGAQVFITGDVRYHDAERAARLGLCVVDAGHFATESIVSTRLAAFLRAEVHRLGAECEVVAAREQDPLASEAAGGEHEMEGGHGARM